MSEKNGSHFSTGGLLAKILGRQKKIGILSKCEHICVVVVLKLQNAQSTPPETLMLKEGAVQSPVPSTIIPQI